jgi:hypothetical protein
VQFDRPWGVRSFRAVAFGCLEGVALDLIDFADLSPMFINDVDVQTEVLVLVKGFLFVEVRVHFPDEFQDV